MGDYAIVTGAAGGLGTAFARELASRGYRLILTDRAGKQLQALVGELDKVYPAKGADENSAPGRTALPSAIAARDSRHIAVVQDLAAPGGAGSLCGKVEALRGVAAARGSEACGGAGPGINPRSADLSRVSVLVNIAGVYANIGDELAEPATAAKLLALHVGALTELCLYFGNRMTKTGGGRILNLSSISSLFHDPSSITYGASKNYVRFFSKSLDLELRPGGVTVSCLMPGGVNTGFFANNNVFIPAMVRKMLLPPEKCAKIALNRMSKGRRLIIPGFSSKVQALLFKVIVRPVFYTFVKKIYGRMKAAE